MKPKIGLTAPPNLIDAKEYKFLVAAFIRVGLGDLFTKAYAKRNIGDSFELNPALTDDEMSQLWDQYVAANMDDWIRGVRVAAVAHYIYEHRIRFGRKGDPDDDYNKAGYLFYLVQYLNDKHSRVIRLRQDAAMEDIIDEVNNIFDSAYFRKLNHPELSDEECFFAGECDFCEDKRIDYLVYRNHVTGFQAAESIREEQIRALAQQIFEWRRKIGKEGWERDDWAEAERQYPMWRAKKQFAMECYNFSGEKFKPEDYYWTLAGEVVRRLEAQGIDPVSVDPYDPQVMTLLKEVVNA